MNKANIFAGLMIVLIILGGGWYIYRLKTENRVPVKALQAKSIPDLGSKHLPDLSGITYNSNPPTSGPHFEVWAKRGIYPYVVSDGYLIHSLEHGYVVISYNCGKKATSSAEMPYPKGSPFALLIKPQGGNATFFTPNSGMPPKVAALPAEFNSPECKKLTGALAGFLNKYDRVIITPRPNLDTEIALTAWNKIDKFNGFKQERIANFIAAFENQGPEKTME